MRERTPNEKRSLELLLILGVFGIGVSGKLRITLSYWS